MLIVSPFTQANTALAVMAHNRLSPVVAFAAGTEHVATVAQPVLFVHGVAITTHPILVGADVLAAVRAKKTRLVQKDVEYKNENPCNKTEVEEISLPVIRNTLLSRQRVRPCRRVNQHEQRYYQKRDEHDPSGLIVSSRGLGNIILLSL
jgi:hypothetical protein